MTVFFHFFSPPWSRSFCFISFLLPLLFLPFLPLLTRFPFFFYYLFLQLVATFSSPPTFSSYLPLSITLLAITLSVGAPSFYFLSRLLSNTFNFFFACYHGCQCDSISLLLLLLLFPLLLIIRLTLQ